ncbi:hypothetical protein IE53DRAFT_13545 [Violaceomyces palustris]|uniref:Uncharacterized protein n=1 Tax=Violaceomyces palustris TaxID=1673888 RepID=A0ACD0NLI9_9BASI|nr:hypothetical protein IE53DRAFT_13545 [Violaceomyces palustris]
MCGPGRSPSPRLPMRLSVGWMASLFLFFFFFSSIIHSPSHSSSLPSSESAINPWSTPLPLPSAPLLLPFSFPLYPLSSRPRLSFPSMLDPSSLSLYHFLHTALKT